MPLSQQQIQAIVRLIEERKRKEAEEQGGWADTAVPAALRVGGGVGGALLGSVLAPGAGTLAGGGIGSALGETAAQFYEKSAGDREEISPTGIAIEGALGAVPLGKAAGLARAAKQGALLAGGGYAAHRVLEEGEVPGLETLPVAGLGALFGAGAHKVFGGLERTAGRLRRPAPPVEAPPEAASPFARLLGSGLVPEERRLLARNPRATDLPAGTIPRPMGAGDVIDAESVATDFVENPVRGLTGLTGRNVDEVTRRAAEAAPAVEPDVLPPMTTALALRPEPRVGTPLNLAPAIHRPSPLRGLLAAPGAVERPIPLPASRGARVSPVASDAVTSPQVGLTGMQPDEAARRAAIETAERLRAPGVAQEAPVPPTAPRSPEPEISQPGPSAQAGAAENASPQESALLNFLRGKSQGQTMAQLRKKFGPGIEAVIEKLAQARKLSWGGKVGNERFSVSDNAGFVGNELQQAIGGGVLGGAVGASQGETPEERVTYGLLGAGAGAAGGAQLAKFLERRRLGPNPSKVAEAVLGPTSATEAAGPIPAVSKIATDKRIPVVGGRTLNASQGDVPIVEITEPKGPIPGFQSQPKARYEQAGFNPNIFRPELRQVIRDYILDDALKAEANQMRRGRISIAAAAERAKRYAVATDRPWKAGTTIKPEELLAVGRMEQALESQGLEHISKWKATGQQDDMLAGLKSFQQARVLYLDRVGASAEAGRTLRYVQELNKLMTVGQRLVSEAQKQGRLTKVMGEFEDLMRQVPDDPAEAAKFLASHMDAGTFDKITSYYMANILSALPSFVRNGIGSAVNSVGRVAVKGALAGPVDALISKLTGRQRAIYSSEILHEIAGGNFAVREGVNDAWSTYRNGFSTRAIEEGVEFGELNVPKVEFTGGLMNPWNQPGRILEATDRFFQTFNQGLSKNGLVWAAAQREADKLGLVGKPFDDFMTQRMAQLMQDDFIREAAVKQGRYTAFREEGGKIANSLIGMKKQAPLLNFIIPFVRTVSNIFRQGIEHSPFAPVLASTRAKMMPNVAGMSEAETWMAHREQSEAFAKWAFGLASAVPIAAYAATGKMSGSGPSDPAKRAALYEQGWRPNSIQIGDKWYNYSTWQPLSIPMSLIANAFEAYEDSVDSFSKEGKEPDWEKVASSTTFKVLNSATQQSYLQGVMALSAAMEDPDQFAENFLRQMAQGFYPLSGLQRTVARGVDPNIRENKTVQESLQRITPGMSAELPSRLNRWGEDVKYSGGPAWRMVGGPVFGGEGGVRDPVNDELTRLGIDVGLPTERVVMGGKRMEFPREKGHELRRVKGQLTRQALERVVMAAGYANLPDEIKRERLEDALARVSRSNARQVRIGLQNNPSDFLSLLRERAANRE